ncbi:hypothetical protein [Inconstantimicrobium mannanitabidum]|uniref:Uncharacterized protein n=1 Tax=Inconstantimicrobium mannanitabidum TaxID=1604901 RepID=A0ACB5R9F5_9CLOT|nr:hypothetical protein [Clostridium sp. TW13]GKX65823.1 hypothetical protein rsdtw13_10810 [Clostridium sp. TW13]
MKTEQELLELFKSSNIDGYKIEQTFETTNSEENFATTNSMQLMCVEDIIKFSCKNNINSMFYYYGFTSEEALVIDDEIISDFWLEPEVKLILQDKFDEHNKRVYELDFNKPIYLYVYIIHQGIVLFAAEQDFWFFEEGLDFPKYVCEKIIDDNMNDINAERENKMERVYRDREVLHQQILNDEEFQQCTNQRLRLIYTGKIFKNNIDNKKLFIKESGGHYDITPGEFIELIWKEYKNNLKML